MKDTPGKKKYDTAYEKNPTQVKNREERNQARLAAERAGTVKKGDKSTDIDHKKPLIEGGSNSKANQRPRSVVANRGWRKGESGYIP